MVLEPLNEPNDLAVPPLVPNPCWPNPVPPLLPPNADDVGLVRLLAGLLPNPWLPNAVLPPPPPNALPPGEAADEPNAPDPEPKELDPPVPNAPELPPPPNALEELLLPKALLDPPNALPPPKALAPPEAAPNALEPPPNALLDDPPPNAPDPLAALAEPYGLGSVVWESARSKYLAAFLVSDKINFCKSSISFNR